MEPIKSLHERASKYSRKSVFILPLLLAAIWPASPVATAAPTVEAFRLRGDTVTATFEAFDPQDPCLEDFVAVVASDLIEKVSPGGKDAESSPRTVLVVAELDVCTGVLLFDGMCETAAQSFQVAEDLRSATLSAQVPVDDAVTRLTYSFQVNLTFQATGAAEFLHSKEMFVDRELGIIVTQLVGFIAPATATGTVFGLGQNFTPEPSDTATIQKENNGTVAIQKTF